RVLPICPTNLYIQNFPPASLLFSVALTQQCMRHDPGRYVNTQDFLPRKNRMHSIAGILQQVNAGFPLRSTCPRTAATIPITNALRAKSEKPVSRSTPCSI